MGAYYSGTVISEAAGAGHYDRPIRASNFVKVVVLCDTLSQIGILAVTGHGLEAALSMPNCGTDDHRRLPHWRVAGIAAGDSTMATSLSDPMGTSYVECREFPRQSKIENVWLFTG
jgi:hypothetical protein